MIKIKKILKLKLIIKLNKQKNNQKVQLKLKEKGL